MAERNKFKLSTKMLNELAAKGRPLDEETIEMMRCVLVEGEPAIEVAKRYKRAPQFIRDRVRNVYQRLAANTDNLVEGCVVRTVVIHTSDENALKEFEINSIKKACV